MNNDGFQTIDWHAPWLAPYARLGRAAAQQVQVGASVAQALNALIASGQAPDPGVRFVPQAALPVGQAYEQFIWQQDAVPTRDNLHDFFNGLVWLHFPQAKRRLNHIHGSAVVAQGVGQRRGALRDALTLLDENGALLLAPAPLQQLLHQALHARQWQRLFVQLRPLWQQAQLLIVGHALLEKLIFPRKPMTAHVYQAFTAMNFASDLDVVDAWLAADFGAEHLAGKPFAPLPVLGVPQWWAENQNFSFYDDTMVFRPARAALA